MILEEPIVISTKISLTNIKKKTRKFDSTAFYYKIYKYKRKLNKKVISSVESYAVKNGCVHPYLLLKFRDKHPINR